MTQRALSSPCRSAGFGDRLSAAVCTCPAVAVAAVVFVLVVAIAVVAVVVRVASRQRYVMT